MLESFRQREIVTLRTVGCSSALQKHPDVADLPQCSGSFVRSWWQLVFSALRVANLDKGAKILLLTLCREEIMINVQLSFARCAAQKRSSVQLIGVQPRHDNG